MADDWKAGDLAVCLQDGWFKGGFVPVHGPTKEQIVGVAAVKIDVSPACACGKCNPGPVWLQLKEFGDDWWTADGFRKIQPDAEKGKPAREEGASWFKRLIKHHKPKLPEVV
jgi:hypothetical protein